MRILILHSAYLSGAASGENRVVEDEVRLLRAGGHEVSLFLPERQMESRLGRLREGMGAIWSRNAAQHVRRLVRELRPDVVHFHNLFPALSPATLRAGGNTNAAVVLTLHNYRLLCLPATLLRDGRICEDCLGRGPWRGVVHRCYRNSAAGSTALATSLAVHRTLRTFDHVHLYLAVSDFVRGKYVEAGFPAERVLTKPNFAWSSPRRQGPGEYFLFAGRLAPEKGVRTLLQAWRALTTPLVVVGDGPERDSLRAAAPGWVEFRNAVPPDQIPSLLSRARALILPSLSFEGAPKSVLEAFAAGVPVLASAIGALPGLVEDGNSGLLVPAGDPVALATAVERFADDAECIRLGNGAWTAWHDSYSPAQGLRALEGAYRQALGTCCPG